MGRIANIAAIASTVLLAAATPTMAAPQSNEFERAVAFTGTGHPDLAPQSSDLLNRMWDGGSIALPGIGLRKVSQTAPDARGWATNEIAIGGEWHGLRLETFGFDGVPHSGIGMYRMHFSDSVTTVRQRLQRLGFAMGRSEDGEGCMTVNTVEPDPAGAVFKMGFSC